ncbi:MAG: GNAT family acetyltransferase [Actinomycetota bacterium]|nr:GNAT family acetyltransferase [Actinomycetota bacterium]
MADAITRPAEIRAFEPADADSLIALWQACGLTRPWNDARKDIARKMADSPWGLLVADRAREVVGGVMVGYDGHRGSVNYLAVAPSARGVGIGTALMDAAEGALLMRGCPKINLQVRPENADVIAFYARRGYSTFAPGDQATNLGLRLDHDGPAPSS